MNKFTPRPFLLILALVLAFPQAKGQKSNETVVPEARFVLPEERFDLKFEGGSVLDLVEATKDLPINLIVPEKTDHLKIPKFEVNAVTDIELFSALNVLLDSDDQIRMRFDTGGNINQKYRVWALSIRPNMLHPSNIIQNSKTLRVITHPVSIGPLLEEFSIDAITTAIAQSVEIFQKSHTQITGEEIKPVNIAFHPETKLLILSGPDKSMAVAADTLKALFDGVEKVQETPPPK